MIYDIYHKTEFQYQNNVTFSHNIARLKPKVTPHQTLLSFSMEIDPEVFESHEFVDMFGNTNTHMLIRKPHHSLSVVGKSKVEIFPKRIEEHVERVKQNSIHYGRALERLSRFQIADVYAKQYLFESALIPYGSEAIKAYALESFHKE